VLSLPPLLLLWQLLLLLIRLRLFLGLTAWLSWTQ
jgi:hypothetical protein